MDFAFVLFLDISFSSLLKIPFKKGSRIFFGTHFR